MSAQSRLFADYEQLAFDLDASQESEADVRGLTAAEVGKAYVTATDWTTETILTQLEKATIELSPRFQRREAWTDGRKSRFIESLFLGLPIPQLVLAEHPEHRGSFIVIDGKQRLLSLRHFAGAGEYANDPLMLSDLELREDLQGKTLFDLRNDDSFARDLIDFDNQPIRTVVVRNWPNEQFLYLVFHRLNTGSVPLSPQELRQALKPGPFVNFVDELSARSTAVQSALGLTAPDFRMRDVEILVRFFAFTYFLESYRGTLKDFFDRTCEELNQSWPARSDQIQRDAERCEMGINATIEIFGADAFHRWNGARFEGRFNRAVFDIMTYYFKNGAIAAGAIANAAQVVEAFKALSQDDDRFDSSLQTTTKTIGNTELRLRRWGEVLSAVLGSEIPTPVLEGDTIRVATPL